MRDQDHLELRAPGAATEPVRDADDVERRHQRVQGRALETVSGTVTVRRTGYGAPGLESLHPLDAALNLPPERNSLGVRRRVAEEASKNSFDETVATLSRHTGARINKRQAEELVLRAAQDFDRFYETRHAAGAAPRDNESGALVVLTSDGKGVVMRQQDLRPATRKAAAQRQHKLRHRLTRGEKRHAKRMATVASVYTMAPFVRTPEQIVRNLAPVHEAECERRPRPEHKRVWASLEKDTTAVLDEAFREAHDRNPGHDKTWVAVVDGDKTQLRALQSRLRRVLAFSRSLRA